MNDANIQVYDTCVYKLEGIDEINTQIGKVKNLAEQLNAELAKLTEMQVTAKCKLERKKRV